MRWGAELKRRQADYHQVANHICFFQLKRLDPSNDASSSGYDWTSGYDEFKVKVKIPEVMFQALTGEVPDHPDWEEGIPPEVEEIMDKLYDAVDE